MSFPMPAGWPRIQNPARHRGSWVLSEQGRATVITSFVPWRFLNDAHLLPSLVKVIKMKYSTTLQTREWSASNLIVHWFSLFVRSSLIVLLTSFTLKENVNFLKRIIELRRAFQYLIGAIIEARKANNDAKKSSKSKKNTSSRGNHPGFTAAPLFALSRGPSPALSVASLNSNDSNNSDHGSEFDAGQEEDDDSEC